MVWLNTQTLNGESEVKPKGVFAVDFDGTIVLNDYPNIGKPNPQAIEVLRELTAKGFRLILFTMRTDDKLNEAVVYCNRNYIDLWGINENPDQHKWSNSRKVYANVYIDDCGAGIPLMLDANNKPCVDWVKLRELFVQWKILDPAPAAEEGVQTFEIK